MKKLTILLLLAITFFTSKAQSNFPAQPTNYVTDDANLLGISKKQKLNEKLKAFEEKNTTQVFIYIAKSLNGNNLETTTQAIFDAWKIGKKGKDNGVLIAIFVNDKKFRIQTGYGVEGLLPDIACNNIQDEYIIPNFKNENYYEGLNQATDQIISYLKGEITVDSINDNKLKPSIGSISFFVMLLAVNLLILFYVFTKEKKLRIALLALMLLAFISLYLGLYIFAIKVSYNALLSTYTVYSFNFLFSFCAVYCINKPMITIVKKITNYVFQFIFIFSILILHGYFCYLENLYQTTGLHNNSDLGIYTLILSIANFIHMLILFMTITPGNDSSKGYGFASSGSYSSSSSSSRSSYSSSSRSSSSGSSFGGGGGGRSGGGGSSGSW